MNDKPPYGRWAGVLLGFLLSGSAHYLSGKRSAGLKWYCGLFAISVTPLALLAVHGTAAYVASVGILLVAFMLWFLMLKQSFVPIRRIGVLGWVGVVALTIVLGNIQVILIRKFVASYKISAASMQPTLLGVRSRVMRADAPDRPGPYQWMLSGSRFQEIKAAEGGSLSNPLAGGVPKFKVGSKTYEFPRDARPVKMPGAFVDAGETLWSGVVTYGDHVMADKLSYHFSDPKRGDLLIFKTDDIPSIQRLATGQIWVKRIAGLPGERIRIEPPYLIVDGKKVTQPAIFQTIASKADGHAGFLLAVQSSYTTTHLAKPTDEVVLGKDEYFVLGDNTENSLDSRYWGPVPKRNIIGKAVRVYWPFTRINALDGQ